MQDFPGLSSSVFTLHLAQTHDFQRHVKKECQLNLAQTRILLDLAWAGETSTTRRIGQRCNISPSSVATALSALEKRGLITRNEDSDDRRVVWVSTTETGRKATHAIDAVLSECITRWWRPLGIDAQNALLDCCLEMVQKVQQNVRQEAGEISFDTVYIASVFRCNNELDKALASEGLKLNEFRMLEELHDKDGGMLSGRLSSHLLMRLSTVTRTADSLVSQELVTRSRDKDDRRATRLIATPKGIDLIKRITPKLSEVYFQELLPMDSLSQAIYLGSAKIIVESMRRTFAPIS